MNDAAPAGRYEFWLPLMRRLSETTDNWYVWKNADSALYGQGDVDSAAPAAAWDVVESTFRNWAFETGQDYVVSCRHIPRTLNVIAASERSRDLLQLEVKGITTFRGSTLFRAEDLLPLTEFDERGFRRLRPGAEGLFKFLTNGVARGGAPNREALRSKRVLELIEQDPDGMRQAAAACGRRAGSWIVAAVEQARRGEWDRRALRKAELAAIARTLTQPRVLLERIWFRVARKPFCPLLRAVYTANRQAPDDAGRWVASLARTHQVHSRNGRPPAR